MRNFKRFLSFMLAAMMVLSMLVLSTSAKDAKNANDYTDAAHHLAAIGILKGDENGNLMLNENVTRYQAALFFVQAITGKTDPSVWNADKSAIFNDVPEYGTAIDYLAGLGFIVGRGNGIYGYHDNITYQDMLVLAVRALGYESEGMNYPYGYILEAGKLGLTDNIGDKSFKEYLNRGETAQLVWDMLGTEIAMIDPITGDIIYPGKEDESAYGLMLGEGKIKRETYLERAGFADGKLIVTVTEFNEGTKNDEIDKVTVAYGGESHILAAKDLGIDENTPKIEYLGLPKTLYVNCKAEEFFEKYDIDGSDAEVVFVSADALTYVENLGDGGNIRYVKPSSGAEYISLGGVKFALDKYGVKLYTFGEDGWTEGDAASFKNNFRYDTREGYVGTNSNGALNYIVRESVEGGKTVKTLHIYYTPYEFGQYFVREIKDATTSKTAEFTTIAKYEENAVENLDKELSHFVEYLVGTSQKVTSSTATVSKRNGEKAKSVKMLGEDVNSGEFIFYYYNEADNIITVAENGGGFKKGQLTGTSAVKETVKIGGTDYGFGFKGAYAADYSSYAANESVIKNAISAFESGYDNVKYVVLDGSVVYIEGYKGTSQADYGFSVVTTDRDILADLLGVKPEKLEYTADFVLSPDGGVYVAVLNTEDGEWELKTLTKFHKDYNSSDDEYEKSANLGELAKYVEIAGESYSKYADYVAQRDAFLSSNIFATVESDGDTVELGTSVGAVDYATIAEGLIFSDNTAKTNKIKADSDAGVSAQRVTLDKDSVIVIIDANGEIGVRTGVQKSKFTVSGEARFYAASSDLIVAYFESPTYLGGYSDASDWGESRAAVSTKTYYAALPTSSVSIETSGADVKEKYTVTVTDLIDLRTLEIIDEVSFSAEKAVTLDLAKPLYADENGVISQADMTFAEAFKAAITLNGDENDITYVDIAPENLTFTDGDTVIVTGGTLTLPNALAGVEVNVVTLDNTGLDRDKYDFDRAALNVSYGDGSLGGSELEIADGVYGYAYPIFGDTVEAVNEPVEGIFDGFIINSAGKELLIPLSDADNYDGAAKVSTELKILAHYDDDTGILTMYVAKIIK